MIQVLQPYISLMRFDRPIGILLLLWPTLIALWLASAGIPDFRLLAIFCAGVIVMRAAGCVINDYADRNFDAHVKRTKQRPLASKELQAKNALYLFALLLLMAFVLVLQLSFYTIILSIVAAGLAMLYPFAKRVTNYPQFVLGLAFAWSIPMAYAEVQGKLNLETLVLFCSTVAWIVAYDTEYAMADKADDLTIGIKSTAISFGCYDKIIIFVLQSLCLLGYIYIGIHRHFTLVFYIGVFTAFCCALYQQWLLKDRDPARCFQAFLNNNYFGTVLFCGCLYI